MQYQAVLVCAKNFDRGLSIFPRYNRDISVIVRRVGSHSSGFVLLLSGRCLTSTFSIRNASYGSVLPTENRFLNSGSKSPALLSEKHVPLFMELIAPYCSLKWTVLSPSAGTCTIVMASLQCVCRVIVVEEDKVCFQLSPKWLRSIAEMLRDQKMSPKILKSILTGCGKRISSLTEDHEINTVKNASCLGDASCGEGARYCDGLTTLAVEDQDSVTCLSF